VEVMVASVRYSQRATSANAASTLLFCDVVGLLKFLVIFSTAMLRLRRDIDIAILFVCMSRSGIVSKVRNGLTYRQTFLAYVILVLTVLNIFAKFGRSHALRGPLNRSFFTL